MECLQVLSVFVLLWSVAYTAEKTCFKCSSIKLDMSTAGEILPILPSALKEDKACEDSPEDSPVTKCHAKEVCMSAKATITAVETNNTQFREIRYNSFLRGCFDIDVSDGRFCSQSYALVTNATSEVISVLNETADLTIKDIKGEICFCDQNVCKPENQCKGAVFSILTFCVLTWHLVVAGFAVVFLSILLFACCCRRTKCFCKTYSRPRDGYSLF